MNVYSAIKVDLRRTLGGGSGRAPIGEIVAWCLLASTAVSVGLLAFVEISQLSCLEYWSGHRLFFPHALLSGKEMYSDGSSGGLVFHIYGPFFPLFYLPTAMFTDPEQAVLAGLILSVAASAASITFLAYRCARPSLASSQALLFACAVAMTVTALSIHNRILHSTIFTVCADTPCMISFMAALGILLPVEYKRSRAKALLMGGLLAVSIYCKPLAVFAIPVFLAIEVGARPAGHPIQRATCMLLPIGVLSVVFGYVFGFERFFLNTFGMALLQPWVSKTDPSALHYFFVDFGLPYQVALRTSDKLGYVFNNIGKLVFDFPVAIAGTCVAAGVAVGHAIRQRRPTNPSVLAACSLFLLPGGIAGYSKLGGDLNPICGPVVLGIVIVATLFASCIILGSRSRLLFGVSLLLLLLLFGTGPDAYRRVASGSFGLAFERSSRYYADSERRFVYEFCKEHPGVAYFPAHNFEQFLAEKTVLPVADTMFCLYLTGIEISPALLRRRLPRDREYIVITKEFPGNAAIRRAYQMAGINGRFVTFEQLASAFGVEWPGQEAGKARQVEKDHYR